MTKTIQETIDAHLKDKNYEESKVPQWINDICEDCVFKLVQLNKPFKYLGALFSKILSSNVLQPPTFMRSPLSSHGRYHAAQRRRIPLVHLVLLGFDARRYAGRLVAASSRQFEQVHVLHCDGVLHELHEQRVSAGSGRDFQSINRLVCTCLYILRLRLPRGVHRTRPCLDPAVLLQSHCPSAVAGARRAHRRRNKAHARRVAR